MRQGRGLEPENLGESIKAFGGTLNRAFAEVPKLADWIQTTADDAALQAIYGLPVVHEAQKARALGLDYTKLSPNSHPFGEIADFLENWTDKTVGKLVLPTGKEKGGVIGDIASGIANVLPDIAYASVLASAMPEVLALKAIEVATGINLMSNFGVEQGIKTAVSKSQQYENGNNFQKIIAPMVGMTEGYAQGYFFDNMGTKGNEIGKSIADQVMPKVTTKSQAINKAIIQSGGATVSTAGMFGGWGVLDEYRRTGQVSEDTFLSNAGVGMVFGMKDPVKMLLSKGIMAFVGAPRQMINDIANSDIPAEVHAKNAHDKFDAVANGTSTNPESDLASGKISINTAILKATADQVLNNKDGFILAVKSSTLDTKIKNAIIEKVNAIHADNDPKIKATTVTIEKIAKIDDALDDIRDNKSWDKTRQEVESAPLKERRDELKIDVQKVYGIEPKEKAEGAVEKSKAIQTEASQKFLDELDKPKTEHKVGDTVVLNGQEYTIKEITTGRKGQSQLVLSDPNMGHHTDAELRKQAINTVANKHPESKLTLLKDFEQAYPDEISKEFEKLQEIESHKKESTTTVNAEDVTKQTKSEEEIQNANSTGESATQSSQQTQGLEQGTESSVHLRDNAQNGMETGTGEEVKPPNEGIPENTVNNTENKPVEALSSENGSEAPPKPPMAENGQNTGENKDVKQTAFETNSIKGREDKDAVGKTVNKIIKDNPHFYNVVHEEGIINDAKNYIQERGIDNSYADLIGTTHNINELPVRHVARQILMQHFGDQLSEMNKMNDKAGATAIADKIINLEAKTQEEGRIGAQTVRFTMWKLLPPQASVFMVDKMINQINKRKLGFDDQGAKDFVDTWKTQVPDMVKKLLTENEEFKNTVDKLTARVKDLEGKIGKSTPRTTKEKATEIAAKVRSLKTDNWGLTFADPLGATVILNGALEITAKTIETTGNVLQAIQDGMEHIKSTKWYRDLKEDERKKSLDKFSGHIRDNVDFNAEDYLKNTSWFRKETSEKAKPTEEQKSNKELNKAKKEADERLKDHIYDIIASHLLVDHEKEEDLSDRLKRELGLTDKEAQSVSDVALKSFKQGAQEIFDKTLKPKIPKEKVQQKAFDKFFNLIKRGVLNDETYSQVFAEKYGLRKNLTPDEKTELTRLGINAQKLSSYGYFGELAMHEFLQYTAKLTDADNMATTGLKLMNSLNYARMLSGPTTSVVNITSAQTNVALRPVLTMNNLGRWVDWLGAKVTGNTEKAKLINPLIDLYYMPESYKIGAQIGLNQAMNIVKHGDITGASKYMEQVGSANGINVPELEKNKYGVGKRFMPLRVFGKDVNPFNSSKYSGRLLLAEDIAGTNIPFALELALASRRAEIKGGTKLSEKELKDKIIGEIQGSFLTDEQSRDIESQLGEQVQALRDTGIEPDEGQIKQRRFELTRSLLNLNPDVEHEALQLAKQDIFNGQRGGVFSTIGDWMGRNFNKNVVVKTATMGEIPFTTVLGHIADFSLDAMPIYGAIRARGYSPTGLIARARTWNLTGDWHDAGLFKSDESPAANKIFKSAQMGEVGSSEYYQQMNRAWFGMTLAAVAGAIFLKKDPKDDPKPRWDITGGMVYSDPEKKQGNDMGAWTMRIPMPFSGFFNDPKIRSKHIDIRYLNIPIINFVLGTVGSYKDAQRAGAEGDDLMAKLHLTMGATMRSVSQIKDTWIAKGIGDLADLVSNVAKSGEIRGRQIVKDPNAPDVVKVNQAVSQGVKNIVNNYASMPFKAIDPLKSNLVQQIWKGTTPEGRLTATPIQLLKYNLGIQNGIPFTEDKTGKPIGSNDLRTDIFGQVVKTLPGDQGIAWPRSTDDRWEKMWLYNINTTDVTPKDRLEVKGIYSTLEFDQYLQRKAETNELFKDRFDDYFKKLTPEELKSKSSQINTDEKTGTQTTQINDEINDLWSQSKSDADKKLFVWDSQAKDEPKLFNELERDGVLPKFWNQKITIEGKKYVVPYSSLEGMNKEAMKSFILDVKEYLQSGDIESDKTPINDIISQGQTEPTDMDEEDMPIFKPSDSVYSRTIAGLWKKATAGFKEQAKEEVKKTLSTKK